MPLILGLLLLTTFAFICKQDAIGFVFSLLLLLAVLVEIKRGS